MKSIKDYLNNKAILVGIGSGMSASGGINYADPKLTKQWFPEYVKLGFRNIFEIQAAFWRLKDSVPEQYWGYWAQHINYIRYESLVLKPYADLKKILEDKTWFICSTNADGQLTKADFDASKIFAPQGDYCYFQCIKPCSQDIYYNYDMVKKMVDNMPNDMTIRTEDIPYCPRCGEYLVPNLRCDDTFVDTPHLKNMNTYGDYINEHSTDGLTLLELGVGYSTPGIIRYLFDELVVKHEEVNLVRINLSDASVPEIAKDRCISLQGNIQDELGSLI